MYLLFISYKGGNHYNCVCSTPEELIEYLTPMQAKGDFEVFPSLAEVKAIEEDLFVPDDCGNWATITLASDYSKEQSVKHFLGTSGKELIDILSWITKQLEEAFLQTRTINYIFVQGLLMEIKCIGKAKISAEVARHLLVLAKSGIELPFSLMVSTEDDSIALPSDEYEDNTGETKFTTVDLEDTDAKDITPDLEYQLW